MQFGLAEIDIGLFGAKPQIYILVLFVVRFKLSRVTRSSHYYVAMCDINHGVYTLSTNTIPLLRKHVVFVKHFHNFPHHNGDKIFSRNWILRMCHFENKKNSTLFLIEHIFDQ